MNIGIDIQSTIGEKTGIGYYTKNLIDAFSDNGEFRFTYYKDPGKRDFNALERIYWENVRLPYQIRKSGADLLHVPGFAGPAVRKGYRKVTTVHDLIGIIFPRNLSPVSRFYWQRWLPYCVRNSDMIIADSENTRRDIVSLIGIPPEKIRVILLAVDQRFMPVRDTERLKKVRNKYLLPEEFVLNVGTIEPRKNISALVDAFASYINEHSSNLSLVLVGKKGWGYEQVRGRAERLGISSRVKFTGYIDDEDMPVVYSLASFFVYPSFYEGFGLPVLEAMSCGKAVACSNVSSLPEITGNAAILVNPYDTGTIREAIKLLDGEVSLREELSGRALQQAHKFSWKETIARTLEVYREVMG